MNYKMSDIKWVRENIEKYPNIVELHRVYASNVDHRATYHSFYSFLRRQGFILTASQRKERREIIKQYSAKHHELSTYKVAEVMNDDGYDWATAGKVNYIRKSRQCRLALDM